MLLEPQKPPSYPFQSLPPKAATILPSTHHRWLISAFQFYISGIEVLLLLFTVVLKRAIHELHAAIICPFSLLYNIPLNTIFILSSGDGHFGLFLIFIYNKYYYTKHSCTCFLVNMCTCFCSVYT